MYFSIITLAIFLFATTALSSYNPPPPSNCSTSQTTTTYPEPIETITRDVAIIGGGSSGCYAAISLLDKNHSVIVIEATSRLGGHTETYRDPTTGIPINLGVVVWHDLPLVRSYLGRFGIPFVNTKSLPPEANMTTKAVTMATGELATGYIPPSPQEIGAAVKRYLEQLAKYPNLETQGFVLPDPVPEDLLIPFKTFVKKYDLAVIANIAFSYGQGIGDILNIPTLYVLKLVGAGVIQNIFETGFLTSATGDNSILYEAISKELVEKESVLFDTTVQYASRKSDAHGYQYITVTTTTITPDGHKKTKKTIIKAKQLLISIPPKLSSLSPYFNLDKTEKSIFSKFVYTIYYTGLLNNTGIPPKVNLNNIDTRKEFGIPDLPGVYSFDSSPIPGVIQLKYGSSIPVTEEFVKKNIVATIERLRKNGVIEDENGEVEFVTLKRHAPFEFTVGREEIKRGFYRDLYALQGKRGTWWTGGAWQAQDSSLLWGFTEGVVGRLVEKL